MRLLFFIKLFFFHKMIAPPGLIQKEKVHIICEKGAQISILANKIVTQWWPNFIIKESNQTIHWFFFIFSLLCLHYIADLIKKLEWRLMIVSVLLEIKFEHAQVSVPKIGLRMSKTACINPCLQKLWKMFLFHLKNSFCS